MDYDEKKKAAILKWANCLKIGKEVNSISDLRNGQHFLALMKLSGGELSRHKLKVEKWQELIKSYLEGYYQISFSDVINFDSASRGDETELAKICTYILLTTFTAMNSVELAECLTNLDIESQEGIQSIFECVLNDSDPLIQQKFSSSLFTVAEAFGNSSGTKRNSLASSECSSPIGRMLQSPINVHKVVVQDKNEIIRKLQKEILQERNAKSYYENEMMDCSQRLEKNEVQLELIGKDKNNLKCKIERLDFEKNQLQVELNEKETFIKTMESKISHMKEEIMELESVKLLLADSEKENIELKINLEKLESAYINSKRGSDLLVELEESNEELRQKLTQKMEEVIHYKNRLKTAESDLQMMKEISLERQAACKSPEFHEEGERVSGMIETELISCREELRELQAIINNKNCEIEQLINEHNATLHTVNESKVALEQRLNDTIKEMTESSVKSNAALNEVHVKFRKQVAELKDQKCEMETKWQSESHANAELATSLSDVRTDLLNLKTTYEDVESRRAFLEKQLQSVIETNNMQTETLRTVLDNLENQTAHMTKFESMYNERFRGYEKQCDKFELTIKLLNGKFNKQQESNFQLKKKLADLTQNYLKLENEKQIIIDKGYEMEQEYQLKEINAGKHFENMKNELCRQISEGTKSNTKLQEEINSYKEAVQDLEGRLDVLTTELSRREAAKLAIDYQNECLLSKVSDLEVACESAVVELNQFKETVNVQMHKIDSLQTALDDEKKNCNVLVAAHQNQLTNLEKNLVVKDEEIKQQIVQLEELGETVNVQKYERDSLKAALDDEKKNRDVLVDTYHNQVINLENNLLTKDEEIKQERAKLELLKETFSLQMSEMDSLKAALHDEKNNHDMLRAVHEDRLVMFENDLRAKDSEIKQRVSHMDHYRSEIENAEALHKAELERLQVIIEKLEETVTNLKSEIQIYLLEKSVAIKDLNEQVLCLKNDIDSERSAKCVTEEKYQKLVTNFENERRNNMSLIETVNSLNEEKTLFNSNLSSLSSEFENAEALHKAELERHQVTIEKLEETVKNIKSEIEVQRLEKSAAIKDMNEQVLCLKNDIDSERSAKCVTEENYQKLVTNFENERKNNMSLTDTVKSLNEDKAFLNNNLSSLSSEFENTEALHKAELERHQATIEKLKETVKNLKSEIEIQLLEKTVAVKDLNEQVLCLKNDIDSERSAKCVTEENYQKLVTNCENERRINMSLSETINSLNEEKTLLNNNLSSLSSEIENAEALHKAELEHHQVTIEKLEKTVKNLKSDIEIQLLEKSVAINNLNEQVLCLKNDIDSERSTKCVTEENYRKLVTNCENERRINMSLSETVNSLNEEKALLNNNLSSLSSEIENAEALHKAELERHQVTIENLEETVQNLKSETENAEALHKAELERHQVTIKKLEETIRNLKSEIEVQLLEKTAAIKYLNEQILCLKNDIDSERSTKCVTEENYQKLVTKFENEIRNNMSLTETVNSLNEEKTHFNNNLSSLSSEIEDLKNKFETTKKEILAKDEMLNVKANELETAYSQLNIYKAQERMHQDELINLHKSISEASKSLKDECKSKTSELDEWKMKYEVLLKSNVTEMCQIQDDMNDKITETVKQVKKGMETEILKLQDEVANSERKHEKAVEMLTKVIHEMKDECRRRKLAEESSRAELNAKDAIIEKLKQQLKSKQPTVSISERRETFLIPKAVSSSNLTTRGISSSSLSSLNQLMAAPASTEVFHVPQESLAGSAIKHTTYTLKKEQVIDYLPESSHLHRSIGTIGSATSLDRDNAFERTLSTISHSSITNKLPDAGGWIACEDEEGEFHNVSYLEDLRSIKDAGRIDELQRRNTLCLPHLRTSYPLETLETLVSSGGLKEEDMKTGNIKLNTLMPSNLKNVPSKDDLVERRKTRVIQGSYRKPGPPTPGKSKPDAVWNKSHKTPSKVSKLFSRPITPKAYAKYKLGSPKPRNNNENSPPGSYVQASPRVAAKKALAFNIGFSPKVKKSKVAIKNPKATSTPMQRRNQD
ncbi:hypothetical protein CHUAL_010214 [Chamberlinius hualienensis]